MPKRRFGEYDENRGLYQDPLAPDQGSMASVAGLGVLALMMYPPISKGLMGIMGTGARGLWSGAKLAGGGMRSVAPSVGTFVGKKVLPFAGKELLRFGKGTVAGIGKLRHPALFMGRHAGLVMGGAVGVAALAGAARGMTSRQPYGESAYENMNFDESMNRYGGLPHDNLGATGDLTLALHNRRR